MILLSIPYEVLFSSHMELNVYILTMEITYLYLTMSAAYDICICATI